MKKPHLLFLHLFLSLTVFSQTAPAENSLLWRISGKNMQRPSYLFGTMHLSDKKIFHLGDSVFKALEQTEGFAAELDMNRIGTQMINYFIKEGEDKKAEEPPKLKDVVNPETWALYKDKLEKKFGTRADKLTVEDLEDLDTRLETDLYKKGDMPTFLDAWLFGLAKKQGKWVGGVEDLHDQLNREDEIDEKIQLAIFDDKYYRGGLDWLMNLYIKQKLDSIDAYTYRDEGTGRKDYIMIRRNTKMARRMDSLMTIRTMMFAVGAAHLPGDSGVISLLRKRGFIVEPVISSRKINPDKYIVKNNATVWETIVSRDSSYSVKMPGIGETVEMFETFGLDVKLFFDLGIMGMYMTFGMDLPDESKKLSADSLYRAMRNRYTEKGKLLKENPVTVNGMEGRESIIEIPGGTMRLQVFLPEMEKAVLNAVFSLTDRRFEETDSKKFFESFVYFKDRPKKPVLEKTWSRMDFPKQSFSIEMPVKPKETRDVVSQHGKTEYNWQGVDIREQVFYGMNISMLKEGMFDSGSDSVYFNTLREQLRINFEDPKMLDSSFATFDGYPAFRLSMQGKAEGDIVNINVVSVLRGGLTYYIYAVYDPNEVSKRSAERFINSFRLTPYNLPAWKNVTAPDESYITSFPYDLKSRELEEENDIHPTSERAMVYDSVGAVSLYVDKTILPDWLWYDSDTAFLRARAQEYAGIEDSITGWKISEQPNLKTLDFMVLDREEDLVKKVRIVFTGNTLYEVYGHYSKQDELIYNRFFNDFRVKTLSPFTDRSTSGAGSLVNLLKDPDQKSFAAVKAFWPHLKFKVEDIPVLQKLALRIYPDFDSSFHSNFNEMVLDNLSELDTNHSSVNYFKEHIATVSEKDEYAKIFIIAYLSHIQTKESYTAIKEILSKYPPRVSRMGYIYHSFYDSLQLTSGLFPEMLYLASYPAFWNLVSGITTSLINSNLLDKRIVMLNGKHFIAAAEDELKADKDELEENAWQYGDLIRLLGIINNKESLALLSRFSKFNHKYVRLKTAMALLENNHPADSRTLYTLGITDEYRHDLYDELKKIGKLKLFPAEFLSQKELGKSKLYVTANDEEQPTSVDYVGERTIMYEGKQQKFLLYRLSFFGSDRSDYLGVAGPYSTNSKEYNSDHKITGIHWEEPYVGNKLDELFKAYMDSFKE